MNYYELRSELAKVIPRRTQLELQMAKQGAVKEKGRKSNYFQYNLEKRKMLKNERLLNTEEINSFVEVSLRAAACPMPLNIDTWDALTCIAKGQTVYTENGQTPIEKIKKGDIVLSYNESKKHLEWKPVIKTLESTKKKMIKIETELGIINITNDHPVYTKRGWVLAKNLTEDDELLEIDFND